MIVRGPRPITHFTMVRNDTARHPSLTFKARGLLVFMLSFPDHWRFRVEDLRKAGPDGRHSITTALEELQQHGYLHRRRQRNPDGTWSSQLIVFDEPQRTIPSIDEDDLWTSGSATPENPTRITGQLMEDSQRKNEQRASARDSRRPARLCGQCRGSGKLAVFGDVDDCHRCGGSGVKP